MDPHPVHSFDCFGCFRLIIQLMAAPAAIPAANVIATVSIGRTWTRLLVSSRRSVAA